MEGNCRCSLRLTAASSCPQGTATSNSRQKQRMTRLVGEAEPAVVHFQHQTQVHVPGGWCLSASNFYVKCQDNDAELEHRNTFQPRSTAIIVPNHVHALHATGLIRPCPGGMCKALRSVESNLCDYVQRNRNHSGGCHCCNCTHCP